MNLSSEQMCSLVEQGELFPKKAEKYIEQSKEAIGYMETLSPHNYIPYCPMPPAYTKPIEELFSNGMHILKNLYNLNPVYVDKWEVDNGLKYFVELVKGPCFQEGIKDYKEQLKHDANEMDEVERYRTREHFIELVSCIVNGYKQGVAELLLQKEREMYLKYSDYMRFGYDLKMIREFAADLQTTECKADYIKSVWQDYVLHSIDKPEEEIRAFYDGLKGIARVFGVSLELPFEDALQGTQEALPGKKLDPGRWGMTNTALAVFVKCLYKQGIIVTGDGKPKWKVWEEFFGVENLATLCNRALGKDGRQSDNYTIVEGICEKLNTIKDNDL